MFRMKLVQLVAHILSEHEKCLKNNLKDTQKSQLILLNYYYCLYYGYILLEGKPFSQQKPFDAL